MHTHRVHDFSAGGSGATVSPPGRGLGDEVF